MTELELIAMFLVSIAILVVGCALIIKNHEIIEKLGKKYLE